MGQYHVLVNVDKKEFVHPHSCGAGLKLWEQLANFPGTPQALIVLLAASNGVGGRGGGDFRFTNYDEEMADVVGSWAGDRVALVGDYAEDSDLPADCEASTIYERCVSPGIREMDEVNSWRTKNDEEPFKPEDFYRDVTEPVVRVIAAELGYDLKGEGWKSWVPKNTNDRRVFWSSIRRRVTDNGPLTEKALDEWAKEMDEAS